MFQRNWGREGEGEGEGRDEGGREEGREGGKDGKGKRKEKQNTVFPAAVGVATWWASSWDLLAAVRMYVLAKPSLS